MQAPDGVSVELVEDDACRSAIDSETLEPEEVFRVPEGSPEACLGDYWQWSGSSLLDNTARGILAEFLVAHALGIDDTPRSEWAPYDLELPLDGLDGRDTRIEVKSSARVQSWKQRSFSPIRFNIGETRLWDPETGSFRAETAQRWADIYVFCTLESCRICKHSQALDTDEWRFYVACTCALNDEFKGQKTVTLGSLKDRLCERLKPCRYATLAQTIRDVARTTCSPCSPVEP